MKFEVTSVFSLKTMVTKPKTAPEPPNGFFLDSTGLNTCFYTSEGGGVELFQGENLAEKKSVHSKLRQDNLEPCQSFSSIISICYVLTCNCYMKTNC
jgi:hypothetical protein